MILQNRWKIEENFLVYYGIRNKPNTTKNHIRLSSRSIKWIKNPDLQKKIKPNKVLLKLIAEKILIEPHQYKELKNSFEDAQFCVECCANDFMIPGLEFDEDGRCPICQSWHNVDCLKSVNTIAKSIPYNSKGLYDVALFYTGGKDSSFLLWYLAKQCKLRVLALMWEIPFASECAKKSLENAKLLLENVTFMQLKIDTEDIRNFYKKLYSLQKNTCACPSLAYIMFFPMLSSFSVPYLVLGNEPAQMKNLYFNTIAPPIAFKYHKYPILQFFYNIARLLSFKKPIELSQLSYLAVLNEFIKGENKIKKVLTKPVPNNSNVVKALSEIKGLRPSIKQALSMADRKGKIPKFVQLDFEDIMGGSYNWEKVKNIIAKDIGWMNTLENDKALHTSCCVERAKDYSQFIAFRNMENRIVPFSAIEICCSVHGNSISRENAIKEIKNSSGFTLIRPKEHCLMENFITKNEN